MLTAGSRFALLLLLLLCAADHWRLRQRAVTYHDASAG
jgi:hypothetical protein